MTLKYTSANNTPFWTVISLTIALVESSILAGFPFTLLLVEVLSSFFVSSLFEPPVMLILIKSLTTSSFDVVLFFAEALTYKVPDLSPAVKIPFLSMVPRLDLVAASSSAKS